MIFLAKDIAEQLARQAEDIAKYLLPEGERHGNEWCVADLSGAKGDSLKVRLTGPKSGVWCDFATGQKGDLLDLWAQKRDKTILESMKEASVYLGLPQRKISDYRTEKFAKPAPVNDIGLITSSSVRDYLTKDRLLYNKTLRKFKISATEDEVVFPFYDSKAELVFVKYLKLKRTDSGKKIIRAEKECRPILFGWHLIPWNAREVVICEGEIDAMTMHQYGFNALSVPFGAGAEGKQKWIDYDYERLAAFDTIYLCFDDDEEGKLATDFVLDRLGRFRCKVVKLPAGDPNECLQKGIDKEAMQYYVAEAKTVDPEGLTGGNDEAEEFIRECFYSDESKRGYESPWQKSKDRIRFRNNELTIWTGINGHGKSQFLGQVILNLMAQGARVCVASLELRRFKFLKRLMIQATGRRDFSEPYARKVLEWYGGKLWLLSLYSKDKAKHVMEIFTYAKQRYGIDVFIIDPFAKLGIAQDDYARQNEFVETLCDFKEKNNCQVHVVVHPRKGLDEYAQPNKLDVKGSGVITDLADNCFIVWRNKAKEKALEKQRTGNVLTDKEFAKLGECDVVWQCDKQRDEDGEEGAFGFWFDNYSLQYLESENARAKQYVEYSCINDR